MIPWHFRITSDLSPDEAFARIRAATDTHCNMMVALPWRRKSESGKTYLFGGRFTIDTRSFWLVSEPYYSHWRRMRTVYHGRVIAGVGQTEIVGWTRGPLLAIAIVGVGLLTVLWNQGSRVLAGPWNMETTKWFAAAVTAIVLLGAVSAVTAKMAREKLTDLLAHPADNRDREAD
ncbi:MAG: hypothetical protein WAU88_03825 [Candidatus Zixiibacteriota bacterium]